MLNDWSNESWDKGSPAETGSKGVTDSVHSSILPDILGKAPSMANSIRSVL